MKLPNKFRDYDHSIIKYFPIVLKELKNQNMTFNQLRRSEHIKNIKIADLIQILDCLYYLNKITLIEGGILSYVENSNLR